MNNSVLWFQLRTKLLFLFQFVSLSLFSNENIMLSFNSNATLDSVIIENLTNDYVQIVKGNQLEFIFDESDLILHDQVLQKPHIYPNPFRHNVHLGLRVDDLQAIDMTVFDLAGRPVAHLSDYVNAGSHLFSFVPRIAGIYLLKVNQPSINQTYRLVCSEANSAKAIIEYHSGRDDDRSMQSIDKLNENLSNQNRINLDQNSEEDLFSLGDLLKFTAFSNQEIDTKYDFLFKSKSYEFNFSNEEIAFQNTSYTVRIPGLIDAFFTVVDDQKDGIDYLVMNNLLVTENDESISSEETFQILNRSESDDVLIRTTLLIDKTNATNLAAFKKAANDLVLNLAPNQQVSIYAYSDSSRIMTEFIDNKLNLEYYINRINAESTSPDVISSLENPLNSWLDENTSYKTLQGELIIFSSGNDVEDKSLTEKLLSVRGDKRVYGITLSDNEGTSSVIRQLASPYRHYHVKDESELMDAVYSIQADILQYANSIYHLSYQSTQRSGDHRVRISLVNDQNLSNQAYMSASYNADGFVSTVPGVYLNSTDTSIYGLDTIRCYVKRPNYYFTNDPSFQRYYAKDQLELKPVTYGGANTPQYSWELSSSQSIKIENSKLSESILIPVDMGSDTVIITLKDHANGFSKKVVYIVRPPEFFEEMQIALTKFSDSRLDEISGIAASIKHPNHFWVHNDSGDDAYIYLVNINGKTVARVLIKDITSRDWEDITVGPGPEEGQGYIYVADIGDNGANEKYKYIYRIPEPEINTEVLDQNRVILRREISAFTITYADGPRDAEILMIEPETKDLYIVTKRESEVQIYTIPYPQVETDTLNLVKSTVTLPFRLANGGDISSDGQEILIKNLENIFYWKREPNEAIIEALARPALSLPYDREPQGEAITWFRDGSAFVTVSEREPILYLYKR